MHFTDRQIIFNYHIAITSYYYNCYFKMLYRRYTAYDKVETVAVDIGNGDIFIQATWWKREVTAMTARIRSA